MRGAKLDVGQVVVPAPRARGGGPEDEKVERARGEEREDVLVQRRREGGEGVRQGRVAQVGARREDGGEEGGGGGVDPRVGLGRERVEALV